MFLLAENDFLQKNKFKKKKNKISLFKVSFSNQIWKLLNKWNWLIFDWLMNKLLAIILYVK